MSKNEIPDAVVLLYETIIHHPSLSDEEKSALTVIARDAVIDAMINVKNMAKAIVSETLEVKP